MPRKEHNDEAAAGMPPQFTAGQAADRETAYDSTCTVCHGSSWTKRAADRSAS